MLTSFDNRQLFQFFIEGNHAAYSLLFERMAPALVQYAYKRLHNDLESAKDSVQEVFIQLWERRDQVEVPIHVEAYFYKAVLFNLLNKIRKEKNSQIYRDSFVQHYMQSEMPIDAAVIEKEFFEKLDREIQLLPPRMRAVFELRYYKHLSNEEVAKSLQISKHTVATQMKRVLKVLRGKMDDRYFWIILYLLK